MTQRIFKDYRRVGGGFLKASFMKDFKSDEECARIYKEKVLDIKKQLEKGEYETNKVS